MQEDLFIVKCEKILNKQIYKVTFPFNEEIINRIKELPTNNRKWDSLEKSWFLTTSALYSLIKTYKGSTKIKFDFGGENERNFFLEQIKKIDAFEFEKKKEIENLNRKKVEWVKFKKELEENYINYSEKCHSVLKKGIKLYPHQIVAANFINITRNTLISHDMGIGKTLTSIVYVELNNFEKVVVLTPNSLKYNFASEVEKFTDSSFYVIGWKNNKYDINSAKYVIINYDFFNLSNKDKLLEKWKKLKINVIDAVICDECQRLKNTKSNTFKNFKRIFNEKIFRDKKISKVFLSGTPAPNRAYELYTVLNQISPLDFPTKKYFYEYYCGMTYDVYSGWGWVMNSSEQKLEELYEKISPFTHRKRKIEVLKDLPNKIYQKIILELSDDEQKTYNEIEEGIVNEFLEYPTRNPVTILLRLRQFLSVIKVKQVVELVETVLETGEKVVIVDYYKESLYELKKIFGDVAGLHTGDQTEEERVVVQKEFQNPDSKIKIFLGTIQTCGYGLTLTAANKMFIITLPYSVGDYDQVADRIHRIGQKNIVNIYSLIYSNSVDEYIFNSLENKRKEITKVLDNEDYKSNVKESVIVDVIEKLKSKYSKK